MRVSRSCMVLLGSCEKQAPCDDGGACSNNKSTAQRSSLLRLTLMLSPDCNCGRRRQRHRPKRGCPITIIVKHFAILFTTRQMCLSFLRRLTPRWFAEFDFSSGRQNRLLLHASEILRFPAGFEGYR